VWWRHISSSSESSEDLAAEFRFGMVFQGAVSAWLRAERREDTLGLAPKPAPTTPPKTPARIKAYSASDIEAEGRKFTVSLGFDLVTQKLVSVVINPAAKDSSLDFNALEAGLISKYGKPTYSSGDRDEITERRWVFPSTTIELHRVELTTLKQTLVYLFYTPTQKSAL
jgi:hypothetical protein